MKDKPTMRPGDIWYNDWASHKYDYRIFLVTRPLGKGVFEIVFRDGTKSRHDSYSIRRDPDRYRLIGHVDLKAVTRGILAPYAPDGSPSSQNEMNQGGEELNNYYEMIAPFMSSRVKEIGDSIYNEFSLQFELGSHLRTVLAGCRDAHGTRVYYERNVSGIWPGIDKSGFTKKEIDLSIAGVAGPECAIELKCPKNGQYPEMMFQFIEDIKFLEELKAAGFKECYAVCLVDDPGFNNRDGHARTVEGIYAPFRNGGLISGTVEKPTGSDRWSLTLSSSYKVDWHETGDGRWYYIIAV